MSVESIAVVLNHSRATGTDKVVLIGIANHEGDGGSYPAVRRLARYANITHRNLQKAISRLVDLGEVKVIPNAGGSRSTPDHARTNVYRILVKCPPECDRTANHRMPGDPGYEGSHPLSLPTPPVAGDTPSPPVAGDGGAPVAGDTTPLSLATPEPSLEPSTEPSKELDPPTPLSRQGSSSCPVHGANLTAGCRGCKTSPRDLMRAAERREAARRRAETAERIRLERAAVTRTAAETAELAARARAAFDQARTS